MTMLQNLVSNRRLLFLIDGLGGIATASMLGLVLPRVPEWIGLPVRALQFLAIVGVFCAAFSLLHATNVLRHSATRLKFIAATNALYCVGTVALLAAYREQVRACGVAYFLVEMAIIFSLVAIEIKAANHVPATCGLSARLK